MRVVTDKQWEEAKRIIDTEKLRTKKGKQPWFVLNKDAEILIEDFSAVCLASLNYQWNQQRPHKGAVLFQVINTSLNYVKKKTISKFLTYMCTNSPVSKFIPRHTSEKRWEVGAVPIALEDVPANLPLTASTYVRWLWDRHNTSCSVIYEWLVENVPEITRAEAFLMANCLDYCPAEKGRSTFSLRVCDGIHSPFCSGMSVDHVSKFFKNDYYWDANTFKTKSPNNGRGIRSMLMEGEGEDISLLLHQVKQGLPKAEARWGGESLPVAEYLTTVSSILKKFKELQK